MLSLNGFLYGALAAAFASWAALSAYVLAVQERRRAARQTLDAVMRLLDNADGADGRGLVPTARNSQVHQLLGRASRELVMRAAADPDAQKPAFDVLAAYLTERWGIDTLVRDAGTHQGPRDHWRRQAALRILFRLDHPECMALLEGAVAGADSSIASVALSLLGQSTDPAALDIMLAALRSQRHPASRIAVHLEQSPQRSPDRLRLLLDDPDPTMRFWGATLLGRYADVAGLEDELAPLADDEDPRVRKAAVAALGAVGGRSSAIVALRLLRDPVPFVRSHAARALGDLERSDLAEDVAALLSDRDWWVRRAAKDALEAMGAEVWPVLVRCLDRADEFARNGAAEVAQDLGILDSLIVMEAATDNPSTAKVDLLRRMAAAGGGRLTNSLIERSGPEIRPRVRQLLATIGLEHVGAY